MTEDPKARVTLNLPAPMYRDVERWATEAAGDLDLPRVSVQNAMRAMIGTCLTDPAAREFALGILRNGLA